MAGNNVTPTYKGSTMRTVGWVFTVLFGLGALWDLAHASVPDPLVTIGTLLGVYWILRGRWWMKKKIIIETAPATPAVNTVAREPSQPTPEEFLTGYMGSENWVPPRPVGELVEPWVAGKRLEVVGETYRGDSFTALAEGQSVFRSYQGLEIHDPAVLVPDPNNPYGHRRAVAVYVRDQHVGYLAQEDANSYFPLLAEIQAQGRLLTVPARTWCRLDPDTSRVRARVSIRIPVVGQIRPSNDLPTVPFVVLPSGRKIQVTKEDEHMDVLAGYVRRGSGVDNYVAASLRSINEIRPRSSYEAVQVEIDGERIGVLTKGQSEKLLPLVRHVEQRGLVPVVRAVVKGSKLKAEVVLDTVDAESVDDDWLDSLGGAVTEANVDKRPAPPERPDFEWDDEEN